jgi:hypothetical protein
VRDKRGKEDGPELTVSQRCVVKSDGDVEQLVSTGGEEHLLRCLSNAVDENETQFSCHSMV